MCNSSPLLDKELPDSLKLTNSAIVKEKPTDSVPYYVSTEHSLCSSQDFESEEAESSPSFTALRLNYLLVTFTVMLADGLQGKRTDGQKHPFLVVV